MPTIRACRECWPEPVAGTSEGILQASLTQLNIVIALIRYIEVGKDYRWIGRAKMTSKLRAAVPNVISKRPTVITQPRRVIAKNDDIYRMPINGQSCLYVRP